MQIFYPDPFLILSPLMFWGSARIKGIGIQRASDENISLYFFPFIPSKSLSSSISSINSFLNNKAKIQSRNQLEVTNKRLICLITLLTCLCFCTLMSEIIQLWRQPLFVWSKRFHFFCLTSKKLQVSCNPFWLRHFKLVSGLFHFWTSYWLDLLAKWIFLICCWNVL